MVGTDKGKRFDEYLIANTARFLNLFVLRWGKHENGGGLGGGEGGGGDGGVDDGGGLGGGEGGGEGGSERYKIMIHVSWTRHDEYMWDTCKDLCGIHAGYIYLQWFQDT
jgi:hypothetical protein